MRSFASVVLIALGVTFATRSTLYVNFTGSLPIGLYRRLDGVVRRGDLVVACLPEREGRFARERGYVWRGNCPGRAAPLGKYVLAISGDTIGFTAAGFVVNGRPVPHSRAVEEDSRGRPVPHVAFGSYAVPADEVWLFSPSHPLSFDSRYFGAIEQDGVRTRIAPVWTFGPPHLTLAHRTWHEEMGASMVYSKWRKSNLERPRVRPVR